MNTATSALSSPELAHDEGIGRDIAVAIRDLDSDGAVVDWVLHTAGPTDHVHIVHAYRPFGLLDCNWESVRNARIYRATEAQRVVAAAQCPLRAAHLRVDGTAIAGDPATVLVDLSDVVDLVVVGDDEFGRDVAETVREQGQCPIVTVPHRGGDPDGPPRPVTVVLDSLDISGPVLEFALSSAVRRGVDLRVVQLRSALRHPEGRPAELLAQEQFDLDAGLRQWIPPGGGVGVVGEIAGDDTFEVMANAMQTSELVVLPAAAAALLAGHDIPCAVAIVPNGPGP